jgi:hypothetical protein
MLFEDLTGSGTEERANRRAFWREVRRPLANGAIVGAIVGAVSLLPGILPPVPPHPHLVLIFALWIGTAAFAGSIVASSRIVGRYAEELAGPLAVLAGGIVGGPIGFLGARLLNIAGYEAYDPNSIGLPLGIGALSGAVFNASITLWRLITKRPQETPPRKRRQSRSAGAIIGAVVDGIVDGTARLETVVGGALALAFAALLAWAIWWLWRNTMPGPEWEWVRVVYMAVLVIFLWLGAASCVVGLKQLRRGFKGAPDLDNQRVHGRADLADEEQAARAARKNPGRGGEPDLDY